MIVVTGAAGKLGRLVADELAKRTNPGRVRLASRDPAKIADLAARGFNTMRADFDDPASLDAAFAGAETVLVVSGDAPNEVRIRQHRAAIDAASKAGVARIVYTSFTNPAAQSLFPFAWIHADTERYLIGTSGNQTVETVWMLDGDGAEDTEDNDEDASDAATPSRRRATARWWRPSGNG